MIDHRNPIEKILTIRCPDDHGPRNGEWVDGFFDVEVFDDGCACEFFEEFVADGVQHWLVLFAGGMGKTRPVLFDSCGFRYGEAYHMGGELQVPFALSAIGVGPRMFYDLGELVGGGSIGL